MCDEIKFKYALWLSYEGRNVPTSGQDRMAMIQTVITAMLSRYYYRDIPHLHHGCLALLVLNQGVFLIKAETIRRCYHSASYP